MKKLLLLAAPLLWQATAWAQDTSMMHMHHMDTDTGMHMDMHGEHKGKPMHHSMAMNHSYSLNLPMSRNGSGTGWLPDASPMYGAMVHTGKWMLMFHGNVFLRYTSQDVFNKGSRGGSKWDAPNWFMGMAQRRVGKNGLLHISAMLSLDRLTEGGAGYPLLYQSGESWKGMPLVDKQHPHDLFSELSVGYTQALSKKSDVFVYLGYPGEPSLGSVAFMHRPSAMYNPDAPISHHWNDGTHITFGVATIGYRYDKWKIEASSFTGREPDENRYNFDEARFDSWSGRLSYNPTANWAFQASHGYVKSPELLHPGENVHRTTAAAIASYPLGKEQSINATAIWGLNKSKGHDGENAVLLEAALRSRKTAIYTRYEWVQKSSEELNLDEALYGETLFPVHALTAGINHDLLHLSPVNVAIGAQVTFNHSSKALQTLYGTNPMAGEVFMRIYPVKM
ncbi:TonB-dependent receptor [Deminuibacter soli]|uniref:Uncharacterized protein n=1 Tax=Deminuibacter soli TaxID=2291815 RepID=A0A3E1NHR7_9BACT|nr:hypothetical protein [Deminuibacter soli]RFM27485.1 hypothetical protein DXN05_15850 [Deminuibacter soli]